MKFIVLAWAETNIFSLDELNVTAFISVDLISSYIFPETWNIYLDYKKR